jgi:hypothetical protein
MRKAGSTLFALGLTFLAVPNGAAAGTFVVVPGVRSIGYPGGFGYARPYGHPFDDGYDYPFGYSEYAEYGPWAYRRDISCYVMRRIWTSTGWRQRAIRVCE